MNRVKEAKEANPDKQIAVAFALFTKASREYIIKNSGFPVSFVHIDVTKEEYIERSMPRVRDFCNATGKTEEEAWSAWHLGMDYGPYGEGCWERLFLKNDYFGCFEPLTESEKDSFKVDSEKDCSGTVPGLQSILGLD
jgi:hypothetical protein